MTDKAKVDDQDLNDAFRHGAVEGTVSVEEPDSVEIRIDVQDGSGGRVYTTSSPEEALEAVQRVLSALLDGTHITLIINRVAGAVRQASLTVASTEELEDDIVDAEIVEEEAPGGEADQS